MFALLNYHCVEWNVDKCGKKDVTEQFVQDPSASRHLKNEKTIYWVYKRGKQKALQLEEKHVNELKSKLDSGRLHCRASQKKKTPKKQSTT